MFMFSEEFLFISFLIVTEFQGLDLFMVVFSTSQTKSAVSCAFEAIYLT